MLWKVRERQRRQLWLEGALWGLCSLVVLWTAAGFAGHLAPWMGKAFFLAGPIALGLLASAFGVVLRLVRVGDDERTARLCAKKLPELSHDVLAAIELQRALGNGSGFSEELARAFLADVDERASHADPARTVDPRWAKRAAAALGACCLLTLFVLVAWSKTWLVGLSTSLAPTEQAAVTAKREPITGDIELTYRYPAHTGYAPRTVTGTNGEVSAPKGTEVQLRTRADREVARADLLLDGARVPLTVSLGRDLAGSFVVERAGSYRFVFLKSSGRTLAEGPDIPVTVELDASPQVRLTAPVEELELDPGKDDVSLRYEASDDFGLTGLSLVYRAPGKEEQRVTLRHDEGRRTQGTYQWDVGSLALKPGQRVTYYLEVKDNDGVEGPKKGVSRTQVLKLYNAAEHRRLAVKKAEELWERLVLHLADRLEGPELAKDRDVEKVAAATAIDLKGTQLAADLVGTAGELARERDVPEELLAALMNIGESFHRAVGRTADARRLYLRYARARANDFDTGKRLSFVAAAEIEETEKDVLYLESLLDRQKLRDLRELAEELRRDRRELASLIEDFKKTSDPKAQEAVLQEIQQMRQRISELMQRMAELAKGIRDEHLNQEALKEMMQERDLDGALDHVERLLKEGKPDEALAKLQELSMQLDQMLESLERGEEENGEEQYPELAKKFQEFMDELEKTTQEQAANAEKTKELRDRYKRQLRERLAQKGAAFKDELIAKADQVLEDYQDFPSERLNPRMEKPLEEAEAELENLKTALQVEDYDLAAESAARAERASQELAAYGEQQRQVDELFQNPPEVRKKSRETAQRLERDAQKVEDIQQKLQQLFPQPGSMLSEGDKQKLKELSARQKELQRDADSLRQQMDEMSQMAPVFNEEQLEQMQRIGQRMGDAAQRMEAKDPSRGYGEQRSALEQLQQFQKQMQQSRQGKGKGGLPLPMYAGPRDGPGRDRDKVKIPDEDPTGAPKDFRKDVLDAMKQGAPDKYKDQVKRYYEELVK